MASLDVTDVLDDPDFWSDLVLIQSVVAIQQGGLAVAIGGGTSFRGVAQPGQGRRLMQAGEGDHVEADLIVWTRYPLDVGTRFGAADVIVHAGLVYTITSVAPWPYGSGYTQAVCRLAILNPTQTDMPPDAGYLG